MTGNEYQKLAMRTAGDGDIKYLIENGVIKIVESGKNDGDGLPVFPGKVPVVQFPGQFENPSADFGSDIRLLVQRTRHLGDRNAQLFRKIFQQNFLHFPRSLRFPLPPSGGEI